MPSETSLLLLRIGAHDGVEAIDAHGDGCALAEALRRTDAKIALELAPPKTAASLLQGPAGSHPVPLALPVGPTVADLLDVLREGGFLAEAPLTRLAQAAAQLGLPLVHLRLEQLQAQAPKALSRSAHVERHFGLPGVAETAALAGAGAGARLLGPRALAGGATCALAEESDP